MIRSFLAMTRTFAIAPAGPATLWSVFALLLVVSMPAVIVVSTVDSMWPILLVPLLAGGLVAYSGYSSREVTFEVSPEGLRIRRSLYGRAIPRDQLLPEEARIVEMKEERGLRPALRTFGTGLPGYGEGWFRLANREKALLFFTSSPRAVYLPTRKGYKLLLSVDRPEEFLEEARRLWG
ncbi:MAG TPA: PH domain-containing protein [Thermoanaerobaculia bacterium]|nr:PH domain-containing protein [Thermoanaerobaculia bacterium]